MRILITRLFISYIIIIEREKDKELYLDQCRLLIY